MSSYVIFDKGSVESNKLLDSFPNNLVSILYGSCWDYITKLSDSDSNYFIAELQWVIIVRWFISHIYTYGMHVEEYKRQISFIEIKS